MAVDLRTSRGFHRSRTRSKSWAKAVFHSAVIVGALSVTARADNFAYILDGDPVDPLTFNRNDGSPLANVVNEIYAKLGLNTQLRHPEK